MHEHTYIYVHEHMYIYVHEHMYIYVHEHTYIYVHEHTYIYVHEHMYMYVYIMYVSIHMYCNSWLISTAHALIHATDHLIESTHSIARFSYLYLMNRSDEHVKSMCLY